MDMRELRPATVKDFAEHFNRLVELGKGDLVVRIDDNYGRDYTIDLDQSCGKNEQGLRDEFGSVFADCVCIGG